MTFTASVARLQRARPALTYSEICAELQRRSVASRRRKKRASVPSKAVVYWWQKD